MNLMNSLKRALFHLSVCRYAEKHRSDSKHVHTQALSELKSFQLTWNLLKSEYRLN